jgi:ribosomal protein S12 methylthiotransferase
MPKSVAQKSVAQELALSAWAAPRRWSIQERIITKLRAEGYELSASYEGADAWWSTPAAFSNSAKEESLARDRRGLGGERQGHRHRLLGRRARRIRAAHPGVLAVTGPQQYERWSRRCTRQCRRPHDPFLDLLPPQGIRLTPRHYAYLKISEGCNNRCSFCIIPHLRGDCFRPADRDVMREAERLVRRRQGAARHLAGHERLRARSQLRTKQMARRGARGAFLSLAKRSAVSAPGCGCTTSIPIPMSTRSSADGGGQGAALSRHPVPACESHGAEGHAAPGAQEKTLDRISRWREICPDLAIRSTFIVGFPGETERTSDFCSIGCAKRGSTASAASSTRRRRRRGQCTSRPGAAGGEGRALRAADAAPTGDQCRVLAERVDKTIEIIVDEVDTEGAIARSAWDAPEIDGNVYLNGETSLRPGDRARVTVEASDEYDL